MSSEDQQRAELLPPRAKRLREKGDAVLRQLRQTARRQAISQGLHWPEREEIEPR